MAILLDSLLLLVLLVCWGAQATMPRWFAPLPDGTPLQPAIGGGEGGGGGARRLWRSASFPLAVAGLVAALAYANRNPDAAVAHHLVPLLASIPGRLLAVLTPALLAASLIASLAGDRLGRTGAWLVGAFGIAACAAASWAGELMRTGEGPPSPPIWLALLVGCRLLLTLAAGELFTPGRPRWSVAGGLALLAYLPLLPAVLRQALWSQEVQLTCGAAALLLLAARWLPAALRRMALTAGLLLAAAVLAQAGHASQAMATGIEVSPEPTLQRIR